MERVSITERPDWREKATEYGFNFHTMYGEPYWSEEAYYKLSLAQVEKLEEVTAELHQMCLQVVEKVIASDELMAKFRIPKHTWGFVRQSWKTNQPSLYSRLDLAWDGVGEPKLLENNADTPTSLYEAAFFQWIWLEDQLNAGKLPAGSDQFNSLQFSTKLEDAGVRWLEPAWKSIISNKALLPMLWEMFPNHPNLLAAYFSEDAHPEMEKYVIKPIFSREGANVSIVEQGKVVESVEGPYGEEGTIVQEFYPLPKFGDSYTLIGSWLINDQPAGIGIREDRALITQDLSRFYPHIFVE